MTVLRALVWLLIGLPVLAGAGATQALSLGLPGRPGFAAYAQALALPGRGGWPSGRLHGRRGR